MRTTARVAVARKKREALGLPLLLKNTVKRYLPLLPWREKGWG